MRILSYAVARVRVVLGAPPHGRRVEPAASQAPAPSSSSTSIGSRWSTTAWGMRAGNWLASNATGAASPPRPVLR